MYLDQMSYLEHLDPNQFIIFLVNSTLWLLNESWPPNRYEVKSLHSVSFQIAYLQPISEQFIAPGCVKHDSPVMIVIQLGGYHSSTKLLNRAEISSLRLFSTKFEIKFDRVHLR